MERVPRWAIWLAAWLVPPPERAAWRRQWLAETWHYAALLRERGLDRSAIRSRLWSHAQGAFADAWQLWAVDALPDILAMLRKPAFVMALIALCLGIILAGSRGLERTRAMLAPEYAHGERLVLISESGIMLGERRAIAPELLDYWRAHNTKLSGMAGYRWDTHGTAWVTPDFFGVLGVRPHRFLLREIRAWKPATGDAPLGVIGRLQPGATAASAQRELRELAAKYRRHLTRFPFLVADVIPLAARIRQPLYSYAAICAMTMGLLLVAALAGIAADLRRSGRTRWRYWAYFGVKACGSPAALTLAVWEFSGATSITLTGGTTFSVEPLLIWLSIVICGGIVWWCLADQQARCRACLRVLEYPVRIGSPGAVLFNHAGTELVCCEGHGWLYCPEVSSDYVQGGGWTAMDGEESVHVVPR